MKVRLRSAVFATVSAVGTAALLSGCGPSEQSPVEATGTVRIGLPPTSLSISALAAAEEYFTDHGLEAELVTVQSGAEAIPMLLNGQLDLALGDGVGTLAAAGNNVPITVVGIATVGPESAEADSSAILAGPAVSGLAALEGKDIAVNQLGGMTELSARSALDAAGVNPETVTFVELPFPQMVEAIKGNRVASAVLPDPFATAGEQAGLAVVSRPQAEGLPGLPSSLWVTSKEFAAEHPETVVALQESLAEGASRVNNDVEVGRTLMGEVAEVPPPLLAAMRMPVFAEDTADLSGVADLADLAVAQRVLATSPDLETLLFEAK